jgi:hypothetical protein
MKRFTDTEKWNDPWFRRLTPELKCFWFFVLDNCDPSGVWKVDLDLANYFIGGSLTEETIWQSMSERFEKITTGKWMIRKFIRFQYGTLSEACKGQIGVFRALKEHGIIYPSKTPSDRVPRTLQERKGEERRGTLEEESEKEPLLTRVRKLFGKRDSTPMDVSEQKAWKSAEKSVKATTEQDWLLIEWAYHQTNGSASQYRRKDMATLLNNWNCEIDRAKTWKNGNESKPVSQVERRVERDPLWKKYND